LGWAATADEWHIQEIGTASAALFIVMAISAPAMAQMITFSDQQVENIVRR